MNVECEVEEFGDVLPGDGAGENQGCVGGEFEVVADFRCECVAGVGVFAFDGVPFADDEDEPLACFVDDAGEALVKSDVEFVDVHEQKADVGFVDGLHGAEDGEFLDAGFLFALAADAGGVEELDSLLVVADADAIYITSGAGDVCDNRLLLARQRVKEVALADVWATDECDANDVVLWDFGDWGDVRGDLVE